jgi:TonB-dependent receptor
MAKKWAPGFSVLGSNTFDTEYGTFGLQLAYSQSELFTKTDASQITDPCYRDRSLTAGCIRVKSVGSGGFTGSTGYNSSNFPPANSVYVPKGAGVRTTDLERYRDAISLVGQWESNDKTLLATVEYLKAHSTNTLEEFSVLALVNDDALFPVPAAGTSFTYNGNQFATGTLTQNTGPGIPTEMLRFQQDVEADTEDLSFTLKYNPNEKWAFNFEAQHIQSDREDTGFISAMKTYSDIKIDNTGDTPLVQFLQPGTTGSPASYFNDPTKTLYWFLLDSQTKNEGDLSSLRLDAKYNFADEGFFKSARFGTRWSDRSRISRNSNFGNWGNLGDTWTGRGGNWNCADYQAFGCGGAYVRDFPNSANIRNPFGDNFQRGEAPVPLGNGSAFFFGGDDTVQDYLRGLIRTQAQAITDYTLTPNAWFPISVRTRNAPGGVWLPEEISDVNEITKSLYGRMDFGHEFNNGFKLTGNFGMRYIHTTVQSAGLIGTPDPVFFDGINIVNNINIGGNGDGVVSVAELDRACTNSVNQNQPTPAYCGLSASRKLLFAAAHSNETIDDSADITYQNVLPSFNAKLDIGKGMLFRLAASKSISRPDLSAYATGGTISDNTGDLRSGGTLETGPLFRLGTGNRLLLPVTSWNYDLSYEWYFAKVGSVTAAVYKKEISDVINGGANVRSFTTPKGVTTDVLFNTAVNSKGGDLSGYELTYIQVYDFLPGPLSGLGTQFTYTYVDASDFNNSNLGSEQSAFIGGLPLQGVSEHTYNAVGFYEKGPFAFRLAYNWRSDFLITPRDGIFPFSPIFIDSTGQLDGSISYNLTSKIKIGVQGVNLLDEVTKTNQAIDFAGTQVTRSAFRNDRRYTFYLRFDY